MTAETLTFYDLIVNHQWSTTNDGCPRRKDAQAVVVDTAPFDKAGLYAVTRSQWRQRAYG